MKHLRIPATGISTFMGMLEAELDDCGAYDAYYHEDRADESLVTDISAILAPFARRVAVEVIGAV